MRHLSLWIGTMALAAGLTLAGCGDDGGMDDLESLESLNEQPEEAAAGDGQQDPFGSEQEQTDQAQGAPAQGGEGAEASGAPADGEGRE